MVERNGLTCGEGFCAVEADIGNPRGEFFPRALKCRAGQNGDPGIAQERFTQGITIRDTALRQPCGKGRKIREEVKRPNRSPHPDAGRLKNLRAALPQGRQNPPDVREIAFNRNTVLKRPGGRVLNRGTDRRIGFAGHGCHRCHQPVQVRRKGKRPQPPAAGSAPFGQPGTDDGSFRVETGNRHMRPPVMQLTINFIGQQNHSEPPRDRGQLFEFVCRITAPLGVARIIQHQNTRPVRVGLANGFQASRGDAPVLLERRLYQGDGPPDDARLRDIRYPGRRRHEQFAIKSQL